MKQTQNSPTVGAMEQEDAMLDNAKPSEGYSRAYTPGPWRVIPDTLDIISDTGRRFVAEALDTDEGGPITETAAANARLIAAAPDLLTALEACKAQLLLHGWNDPIHGLKSCAALVQASAAIAKAKGAQ